jgi:hypothetical protein
VEVDGEATDSVAFIGASDAAVRFELGDGEGGLTLPTLAVRPIDQEWEPLVVTDEGGAYAASLPPHLDGVIAMKLEGVDVSGNRLTLHWDRAFIARSTPTDVLISPRSAVVVDGVVKVSWHASRLEQGRVTIQRREASDAWLAIGSAGVDPNGVIEYADSTAQAGHTYGYRVFLPNAGAPISGGETWITVDDRPLLSLAGARPNPVTVQPFLIELSLASTGRARLSFIDLAGRRVLDQDLSALGPGRHAVRLGEGRSLRPGLYFVRLEQAGEIVTRRVCVLR